jgi:hypothetical protein
MKTAIVILSDPKPASDEATTRLLNALAVANECKRSGDTLEIAFAGTGTRWPEELVKLSHPANALFNDLREHVVGASRSCAARNGATAGVEAAGLALIGDNQVPGTVGVLSIRRYYEENWNVAIF